MTKSSMAIKCTSVRPSSMAELMRRYDATYITQWREFMATPEATGSHWKPPLGEYSHRIAPADDRVCMQTKKR